MHRLHRSVTEQRYVVQFLPNISSLTPSPALRGEQALSVLSSTLLNFGKLEQPVAVQRLREFGVWKPQEHR